MKPYLLFTVLLLAILLTGCKENDVPIGELSDLTFSVLPDDELPDNLNTIIEGRKRDPFQLTYATKDALYIVRGYGEQPTGGYSIQVRSLCEDANTIFFDSVLFGPSEQDRVSNTPSYPYIVLRVAPSDKTVDFGD